MFSSTCLFALAEIYPEMLKAIGQIVSPVLSQIFKKIFSYPPYTMMITIDLLCVVSIMMRSVHYITNIVSLSIIKGH